MQGPSSSNLPQHPCRPFHAANARHHAALPARGPQLLRCALPAASTATELQPSNMLLVKAVEMLFSIKPVFARASAAVSIHIAALQFLGNTVVQNLPEPRQYIPERTAAATQETMQS